MRDELAIFDEARGELQGKQIEDDPEAAKGRRGIATAVESYSASAECRDFADHVQGIAGGQLQAVIIPQFVDEQKIGAKALFNASSELYASAYATFCGGTQSCVPQ